MANIVIKAAAAVALAIAGWVIATAVATISVVGASRAPAAFAVVAAVRDIAATGATAEMLGIALGLLTSKVVIIEEEEEAIGIAAVKAFIAAEAEAIIAAEEVSITIISAQVSSTDLATWLAKFVASV